MDHLLCGLCHVDYILYGLYTFWIMYCELNAVWIICCVDYMYILWIICCVDYMYMLCGLYMLFGYIHVWVWIICSVDYNAV